MFCLFAAIRLPAQGTAPAGAAAAAFSFRFPFPCTVKSKGCDAGNCQQNQDVPDIHG